MSHFQVVATACEYQSATLTRFCFLCQWEVIAGHWVLVIFKFSYLEVFKVNLNKIWYGIWKDSKSKLNVELLFNECYWTATQGKLNQECVRRARRVEKHSLYLVWTDHLMCCDSCFCVFLPKNPLTVFFSVDGFYVLPMREGVDPPEVGRWY